MRFGWKTVPGKDSQLVEGRARCLLSETLMNGVDARGSSFFSEALVGFARPSHPWNQKVNLTSLAVIKR